jgi:23S rRNA pseudouridine1911/1915/1917 synthase
MRENGAEGSPGNILEVSEAESGSSLLEFLSGRVINESKTALRRLAANGRATVNGHASTPGRTVWRGDTVALPPGMAPAPPPPQELPIELLHEDESHVCVNKQPGVPVLPGRSGEGGGFFRSLVAVLNRKAPPGGPYVRPHVVHRLDTETSGVLLVARDVESSRRLGRQFQARTVSKTYLCIVEGRFPRGEATVDVPLGREGGSSTRMRPDERRGKPAETRFTVRERFGHFTLLSATPLTGRQHQIRVHLAAAGYPLAADRLYGRRERLTGADFARITGAAGPPEAALLDRAPLHAASIAYRHPATGAEMLQEAPLPADLAAFLDALRAGDPALRGRA